MVFFEFSVSRWKCFHQFRNFSISCQPNNKQCQPVKTNWIFNYLLLAHNETTTKCYEKALSIQINQQSKKKKKKKTITRLSSWLASSSQPCLRRKFPGGQRGVHIIWLNVSCKKCTLLLLKCPFRRSLYFIQHRLTKNKSPEPGKK